MILKTKTYQLLSLFCILLLYLGLSSVPVKAAERNGLLGTYSASEVNYFRCRDKVYCAVDSTYSGTTTWSIVQNGIVIKNYTKSFSGSMSGNTHQYVTDFQIPISTLGLTGDFQIKRTGSCTFGKYHEYNMLCDVSYTNVFDYQSILTVYTFESPQISSTNLT